MSGKVAKADFFGKFSKTERNCGAKNFFFFSKKNTLTLALLVQVLVILIVLYAHHLLVYIAVFFHFKATADTSPKTLQAI